MRGLLEGISGMAATAARCVRPNFSEGNRDKG
jgi:hypothetical protein